NKEKYTVVGSRSHMNEETEKFIEKLKKQYGEIEFISKGSSLKIVMVAEGRADIYPRFAPTMEWDTAAGHAIALYAGCEIMEDDEKTPLIYNKKNLLNPWFIVKRKC
ncbi:MAG: inositol monophosphatase family protein, partial [Bacteroidota bacterium]|nr:inositol monophosphatase family protein [Bacteroidota bacterium]